MGGGGINPPDLPFLASFGKSKENHPKKQGIFLHAEPLNSLGKKGKTLKKARKFLATKKARKSKKKQLRKGRSGPSLESNAVPTCAGSGAIATAAATPAISINLAIFS